MCEMNQSWRNVLLYINNAKSRRQKPVHGLTHVESSFSCVLQAFIGIADTHAIVDLVRPEAPGTSGYFLDR